ncbi:hypothetical protein DPMN_006220 [Dreissena polymorpha]|uniref:Uncharacterized protein n=1 Tax=Dreissena polymorpha TaxID=45954 RepID=A0A9D4RUP1_DREPO|nr:hypothetical protein DPMN_006220 [Dreissena polymorpha]
MDENNIVMKRSKMKGCSSGLARMSKAMDIFLSENPPVEHVKNLQLNLAKCWSDYEREYSDRSMFRSEERLEISSLFERTKIDYLALLTSVKMWLATKVTPSSVSGGSSQKTASSTLRKRQLAELKLAQTKRRLEMERRRIELELQQKLQQTELQQQIEIQALEDRIARSEICYDSDSQLSGNSDDKGSNKVNPVLQVDTKSSQEVTDYITGLRADADPSDRQADVYRIFRDMTISVQESLNLPKPEILTFSGNPADYSKFIQNFETNIECRVTDDRLKLFYSIL